jgi:hypothetical protein
VGDEKPNSGLSFKIVESDEVYERRARQARRRERLDGLLLVLAVFGVLMILFGVFIVWWLVFDRSLALILRPW